MASSVSGRKNQIALCAGLATRASKTKLPCPFGTIRPVPQEKFPRKPNNNIDHDFSLKMAGDWPRCEFMDLDFVSVHKQEKNKNLANIQPS